MKIKNLPALLIAGLALLGIVLWQMPNFSQRAPIAAYRLNTPIEQSSTVADAVNDASKAQGQTILTDTAKQLDGADSTFKLPEYVELRPRSPALAFEKNKPWNAEPRPRFNRLDQPKNVKHLDKTALDIVMSQTLALSDDDAIWLDSQGYPSQSDISRTYDANALQSAADRYDLKALNIIATRKAMQTGTSSRELVISISLGSAYGAKLQAAIYFGLFKPVPAPISKNDLSLGMAHVLLARHLGDNDVQWLFVYLGNRLPKDSLETRYTQGTSDKMYAALQFFDAFQRLQYGIVEPSRQRRFGVSEFAITRRSGFSASRR